MTEKKVDIVHKITALAVSALLAMSALLGVTAHQKFDQVMEVIYDIAEAIVESEPDNDGEDS